MCRIQWHFRSNLQTSSSVWLFKEYDFVLTDHKISVFTTLCCQVVAIWRYQLLSYLTSDHRSEPINFYNILVSDRHDLTLSIISYLLSDRRSDANTILLKNHLPMKHAPPCLHPGNMLHIKLTINVFLLGWYLFLGGRLADELGKPLSGQAVLSGCYSINKALSRNIRTVQKFVYIHHW